MTDRDIPPPPPTLPPVLATDTTARPQTPEDRIAEVVRVEVPRLMAEVLEQVLAEIRQIGDRFGGELERLRRDHQDLVREYDDLKRRVERLEQGPTR